MIEVRYSSVLRNKGGTAVLDEREDRRRVSFRSMEIILGRNRICCVLSLACGALSEMVLVNLT